MGGRGKGGGNLPPPFGQLLVPAAHILYISEGINGIRQCGNDVGDGEPPFIVVQGSPDLFAFKNNQMCIHLNLQKLFLNFFRLLDGHNPSRRKQTPIRGEGHRRIGKRVTAFFEILHFHLSGEEIGVIFTNEQA